MDARKCEESLKAELTSLVKNGHTNKVIFTHVLDEASLCSCFLELYCAVMTVVLTFSSSTSILGFSVEHEVQWFWDRPERKDPGPRLLPCPTCHVCSEFWRLHAEGALPWIRSWCPDSGAGVTVIDDSWGELLTSLSLFQKAFFFSFMTFVLICRNYFCVKTLTRGHMSYAYLF